MWTPNASQIVTAAQRQAEADAATWSALRCERDRRLLATDYTQMSDWPGDPEPWRAYRQALRDLPANTTDPASPDWPAPPSI